MRGTHDVADFTSKLVEWAAEMLPGLNVMPGSSRLPLEDANAGAANTVLVRLATVEGLNGTRSRDTVGHRLKLEYRFDLLIADPVVEHQTLADLAFALLERPDVAESDETIRGESGSIRACFTLDRRRDLPRAKPVREAVIDLYPQAQVAGFVRADDGFPIARARVRVLNTDRLILTGNDGGFAFAAPEGLTVRATVTAKGKTADVELKPGDTNVITLAMEP